MATGVATNKTRCVTCSKERATFKCGGCSEDFCIKHLEDHRQQLQKELEQIEINRDLFRQSLTEHIQKPNDHIFIKQINQWEHDAIEKIQQTAEEARAIVVKHNNTCMHQFERKLNKLTDELRECRESHDFNEINLHQFDEELKRLTNELSTPSNILIKEDSTSFITKLFVIVSDKSDTALSFESLSRLNIREETKWLQNSVTVAGGNGRGDGIKQLKDPIGMFLDDELTIYIADYKNHRILEWKSGAISGQVVAGGNGKGNQLNQLNGPTDVIVDKQNNSLIICDADNKRIMRWPRQNGLYGQILMSNIDCRRLAIDNDGSFYVSDSGKNEIRRWKINDTVGTLVAGGNGKGNRLNQLDHPTFIFVDEEHSVYVSDSKNHRVMKWIEGADEGIVVAGGSGQGNNPAQLSYPQGLYVDRLGTTYVVDNSNHRIMRWSLGGTQGTVVVGGNGKGDQPNQLNYPTDLSVDSQGNLYVVDQYNYRVQRFNIDQS